MAADGDEAPAASTQLNLLTSRLCYFSSRPFPMSTLLPRTSPQALHVLWLYFSHCCIHFVRTHTSPHCLPVVVQPDLLSSTARVSYATSCIGNATFSSQPSHR